VLASAGSNGRPYRWALPREEAWGGGNAGSNSEVRRNQTFTVAKSSYRRSHVRHPEIDLHNKTQTTPSVAQCIQTSKANNSFCFFITSSSIYTASVLFARNPPHDCMLACGLQIACSARWISTLAQTRCPDASPTKFPGQDSLFMSLLQRAKDHKYFERDGFKPLRERVAVVGCAVYRAWWKRGVWSDRW
jgi:hypothetical protein